MTNSKCPDKSLRIRLIWIIFDSFGPIWSHKNRCGATWSYLELFLVFLFPIALICPIFPAFLSFPTFISYFFFENKIFWWRIKMQKKNYKYCKSIFGWKKFLLKWFMLFLFLSFFFSFKIFSVIFLKFL